MKHLVDTNICIGWLKGDQRVRKAWLALDEDDVLLSSVVRAELLYGARHSQQVAVAEAAGSGGGGGAVRCC